jgi:hypothetical protein
MNRFASQKDTNGSQTGNPSGTADTAPTPFLKSGLATKGEIAEIRQAVASSQAVVDYDNPGFLQALGCDVSKWRQPRAQNKAGHAPA